MAKARAKAGVTDRAPERMDQGFLEAQRAALVALGERIAEGSGPAVAERDQDAARAGDHIGDAAAEATDMELALGALSRERDAMAEIRDALARIDSGAYGVCEFSGEPIPRPRLEAIPFARFTVSVQAQIEAGQIPLSRALPGGAGDPWGHAEGDADSDEDLVSASADEGEGQDR